MTVWMWTEDDSQFPGSRPSQGLNLGEKGGLSAARLLLWDAMTLKPDPAWHGALSLHAAAAACQDVDFLPSGPGLEFCNARGPAEVLMMILTRGSESATVWRRDHCMGIA